MNPFLLRALACIDASTRNLSPEQIARPIDGRWSILQILEHLTLAYEGSTRAVERILASGEPRTRSPGIGTRLARMVVLAFGTFPPVKSPGGAVPRGSVGPEACLETVHEALRSLDRALQRAAERFGAGEPLFDHPYLGGMSAQQWRKFHWRHTEHHMRQVRRRARLRP